MTRPRTVPSGSGGEQAKAPRAIMRNPHMVVVRRHDIAQHVWLCCCGYKSAPMPEEQALTESMAHEMKPRFDPSMLRRKRKAA